MRHQYLAPIVSICLGFAVGTTALAETLDLSPELNDVRIRTVSISQNGQIDIRFHSGIRGHADRTKTRTLMITGSNETGEIAYQHEYRLHSGQTYASLDMSVVTNWNEMIWSAYFTD